MKVNNIISSFKKKNFIYGGYSTLFTIIFILILIIVNLLVDQFNINIDMTKNKMFSLSQQSEKILGSLKEKINIIGLYSAGKEEVRVKQILESYESISKNISIQFKDPLLYPQLIRKYTKPGETVNLGSLIVTGNSKYKIIDPSSFVNLLNTDSGQSIPESLAIEQRLTGAIMYVIGSGDQIIYELAGHNESELPYAIKMQLANENYTVRVMNLLIDKFEHKSGIILINSPKRDISLDELQKLKTFFESGGRGIFLLDLLRDSTPNLNSLLKSYGVAITKAIVVEGDQNFIYDTRNPLYLIPQMNGKLILGPLISQKLHVLLPAAQPIEILKQRRQTLEIDPLLTTTISSWGKTNINTNTLEKERGDLNGPFNVGVAIGDGVDLNDLSKNAKIIVIGSSLFLDTDFLLKSNNANLDFFMNSLNWLQDRKQDLYIRPKSLLTDNLNINGFQQMVYSVIVVIGFPFIVGFIGLIVWFKRRNL